MSFDLAGNPIVLLEDGHATRRKRARPFDPNNLKTWHEVEDLQPRLKERLRLGAWIAWHVRKQGDRATWGDERRGARRAGIIETVPLSVAVLDWYCCPTEHLAYENVIHIELKSEIGKLSEPQAETALRLAKAGQEVAVLRPRHFVANLGVPDLAFVRLVEHRRPAAWASVLVQPDWTLKQVLAL